MEDDMQLCDGSGHLVTLLRQCPQCSIDVPEGMYTHVHYVKARKEYSSG